jgi:hypothetical protein
MELREGTHSLEDTVKIIDAIQRARTRKQAPADPAPKPADPHATSADPHGAKPHEDHAAPKHGH